MPMPAKVNMPAECKIPAGKFQCANRRKAKLVDFERAVWNPLARVNWKHLRYCPWVDTRARFVARTPPSCALLDLGASKGETLRHIAELRPDARLFAFDLDGLPEAYPAGCDYQQGDLEKDRFKWREGSMDAVTCMHVVEHLRDMTHLINETKRVLKPGGQAYFESPHPRTLVLSSCPGPAVGTFCMNFADASCHIKLVPMGLLAEFVRAAGLEVVDSGTSRNWAFAALYPLLALLPASRPKFTAYAHWVGWSGYLIARKKR